MSHNIENQGSGPRFRKRSHQRNVPISFFLFCEGVEEAVGSRTKTWPGVPPFFRGMTTVLVACCQVAILPFAQRGLGCGGGSMVMWQPKGSGKLAPVWARTACPKVKPMEEVLLINSPCSEGHLYGKEKEQLGRSLPTLFQAAHRLCGHFGLPPAALVGGQLETDMLCSMCHAKSLGLWVCPGHIKCVTLGK